MLNGVERLFQRQAVGGRQLLFSGEAVDLPFERDAPLQLFPGSHDLVKAGADRVRLWFSYLWRRRMMPEYRKRQHRRKNDSDHHHGKKKTRVTVDDTCQACSGFADIGAEFLIDFA